MLGGEHLLNDEGAAPPTHEVRGRRRKKGGRRPKLERGRSQVKRVVLKPRRALARGRSRAKSVNRIIVRTPPLILDTRLHDTHNKGTYICDDCEQQYHGPFQGEFIEEARDLTYDNIASGWRDGTVDATWFCVDCWGEKLGIASNSLTREALDLPPASRPAEVTDNRFHQHTSRWSLCDNCDTYCAGRARDYLPGSFVFAMDNTLAGPPKDRKDASPSSTNVRNCGGTEDGTPSTSAGRASSANETACLTISTNGWRSTTQGQQRRLTTSGRGGHRAARGQGGTSAGATHHTTVVGTTVRASGRRPFTPAHGT